MNVIKFAISRSISKSQISNLYKYLKLITVTMMISLVFSSCAFEEETTVIGKYRKARYALCLEKVTQGKTYDLVFAGDSLTDLRGFEEEFRDYDCLNLGIGGDMISDLRKRLYMITNVKPKKLFILIGINSINDGEGNFSSRVSSYDELIKELRTSLPDTEIYLESVLPVNPAYTPGLLHCTNYEIKLFNTYVEKIAEKYNAQYIDLYSLYEVDGVLRTSVTIDGVDYNATIEGLHLTDEGYCLWYDAVRQYVEN